MIAAVAALTALAVPRGALGGGTAEARTAERAVVSSIGREDFAIPEPGPPRMGMGSTLDVLERRADALSRRGEDLRVLHQERVMPLVQALGQPADSTGADPARIAMALLREGRDTGLDPRLLLAVLLVENPWLDPRAESPMGAVGLMQVMPFHSGAWGCAGGDLEDLDQNICHGARILADALRRTGGDLDAALLRYNGCVHGTNTPDCHLYPTWVYTRAGEAWMAEIATLTADARQFMTALQ